VATFIKMLGVEIPVDVEGFMTPQWKDVLDFHPTWKKAVDWSAYGEPWPFQPYMLEYAKALEKLGATGTVLHLRARKADEWMQRCLEHYGLPFISHYASKAVS
jgi:hypothetical protein